jgi:hypothetical protein
MNKYEKLIEYIISEQEDLARELFHEIVVEKSRSIYESLIENDPEMEGEMGGMGKVDELMHDVEADEGVLEADDEMPMDMGGDEEMGGDDMGDDMGDVDLDDMGGDEVMGGDEEMGGDEDLEDRVMDLESALDDLKAEFDKMMAGEEAGEEDSGEEDLESEEDSEEDEEQANEGMVREYVEKVAAPASGEGHEVGAGKSAAINKSSPALQKANNMGGKRFDLGKGAESAPDGQRPHSTVKAPQEIDVAKKNVNKPGGNKGAQDFYGTKAKAKAGEEGSVNKKSIESGN